MLWTDATQKTNLQVLDNCVNEDATFRWLCPVSFTSRPTAQGITFRALASSICL